MSGNNVFISYRRDETRAYARLLHDYLASRPAVGSVFMDVNAIGAGADFTVAVTEALSRCSVLLALIGQEWSTITDSNGRRRINNPDDWVRIEIEAALQRNIRVIPVLIDGASVPRAADLPRSLRPLTHRQALELRHAQFEQDSQRIAEEVGGRWIGKLSRTSARYTGWALGIVATEVIRRAISRR